MLLILTKLELMPKHNSRRNCAITQSSQIFWHELTVCVRISQKAQKEILRTLDWDSPKFGIEWRETLLRSQFRWFIARCSTTIRVKLEKKHTSKLGKPTNALAGCWTRISHSSKAYQAVSILRVWINEKYLSIVSEITQIIRNYVRQN